MDLRNAADRQVGDQLFCLPNGSMTREERVRWIRKAVGDDRIREEDMDGMWARVLEELQRPT
jgi:hypothetical protein